MKYFILTLICLLSSCKDSNAFKEDVSFSTDSVRKTENKILHSHKKEPDKKKHFIFSYRCKDYEQVLDCDFINKDNVKFKLSVIAFDKIDVVFEGTAILNETFDGETISDEEDNGYFVQEFVYNIDKCNLVLRIDTEDYEVAKVLIRDCDDKDFISKINSSNIMKLK